MADFASMIGKERERITKLKEEAHGRRKTIDDEIAGYDHELKRFDAYENFGKTKQSTRTGTGTRRGSRQDGIIELLTANTDGMTRGELLEKMGVTGDKTAGQSISNALANMKKAGKLGRSKEGRYTLA